MNEMTQTTIDVGKAAAALPFQAGETMTHRGISVTPLFPLNDPVCAYISLADAVAKGVTVTEVDEEGDVGEIIVKNPTPHRVLLYDGEEVAGAKQDRIINVSVLVAAGAEVSVPVSCIEVGRWRHESQQFRAAGRTPATEVRRAKALHLEMEPMERGAAQSAVWDAVARKEDQHGFESGTSKHGDLIEHERTKLDDLARAFALQPGQCGMVLGADGRVVCMDAVSRPDVFAALHGPLLTGYMLDAMHALDGTPAPDDAAAAFMTAVARADRRPRAAAGLGTDVRLGAQGVVGSALELGGETIQLTAFRREGDDLPWAASDDHQRIARPSRRRR
jgi:hypothetical protein